MLCEKCRKDEATVHYCVGGAEACWHLCETCAATIRQQSGCRIECGWISDGEGTRFVCQEINDDGRS